VSRQKRILIEADECFADLVLKSFLALLRQIENERIWKIYTFGWVIFDVKCLYLRNKFENAMNRTIFNEAQLELLNVMASVKDDAELLALKHTISEFFARRADEEMEKLWQSGEWNEQTLQDLKTAHYRTPYRK